MKSEKCQWTKVYLDRNLDARPRRLEPEDSDLPPPWLFRYILRAISPAFMTADSLLLSLETLP